VSLFYASITARPVAGLSGFGWPRARKYLPALTMSAAGLRANKGGESLSLSSPENLAPRREGAAT
jgi:hypothetical protein